MPRTQSAFCGMARPTAPDTLVQADVVGTRAPPIPPARSPWPLLQAAQAKLRESKDAKKRANDQGAEEDDDIYVYLPPGSSMRDPVSLPNSMSDPLDNRKVSVWPAGKAVCVCVCVCHI